MRDWEDVRASAGLLHLLTCATCQGLTIARLIDEQRARLDDEETKEEICAGPWNQQTALEAIERNLRRLKEAEALFSELMRSSAVARLPLLGTARFRNLDLLDRLLRESHEGQLADPARAAELARLAARLASAFRGEREDAAAALSRALLLGANARRLEFRPKAAESLLTKAARCLPNRSERAYFCRTAALVRWELGRYDEAEALLQHACCLYKAEGHDREVGACLMLLGLLLQETDWHEDMLSLLLRGWIEIDRGRQPHLALRGGLALVAALARVERPERARAVLEETYRLFSHVTDPEEKIRLCWWEARALVSLGSAEEALPILESVRRHFLAERSPAEAALISLDLVLAHSAAGRVDEMGSLYDDLESVFAKGRALDLAWERIALSQGLAKSGNPRLREVVSESAVLFWRTFRTSGLRIKPLWMA
jgi:tetratricopeptide (TPR) repeat protein